MAAILDRQHTGRWASHPDLDAFADTDGDDDFEDFKSQLTPRYLWYAEVALLQLNQLVISISDGKHNKRHTRAKSYARQLSNERIAYVAAELDDGEDPGTNGTIYYVDGDAHGLALCNHIAAALAELCPELDGVDVTAVEAGGPHNKHKKIGGFSGAPSNLVPVVFQPCSLRQIQHSELMTEDGLRRMGEGLALGIHAWSTE